MITRTEYILKNLRDLYAMPDMPKTIYSIEYIIETLFTSKEITQELIQNVKNIINKRVKNGKASAV